LDYELYIIPNQVKHLLITEKNYFFRKKKKRKKKEKRRNEEVHVEYYIGKVTPSANPQTSLPAVRVRACLYIFTGGKVVLPAIC
jgi:hypothetical protein